MFFNAVNIYHDSFSPGSCLGGSKSEREHGKNKINLRAELWATNLQTGFSAPSTDRKAPSQLHGRHQCHLCQAGKVSSHVSFSFFYHSFFSSSVWLYSRGKRALKLLQHQTQPQARWPYPRINLGGNHAGVWTVLFERGKLRCIQLRDPRSGAKSWVWAERPQEFICALRCRTYVRWKLRLHNNGKRKFSSKFGVFFA